MSFPLSQGSNPESNTVIKDTWTMIADGVNYAVLKSLSGSHTDVYFTYVSAGGTPPSGLDIFKERFFDVGIEFVDGRTARDLYVYPVGGDAVISAEV